MKQPIHVVWILVLVTILSRCSVPDSGCVDFQAQSNFPQEFAGPTFEFSPLLFYNPLDRNGNPVTITLEDRGEDHDGKPELNIPYSSESGEHRPLIVEFPEQSFKSGIKWVSVELRHFNGAEIIALDPEGNEIVSARLPEENVRRELVLEAAKIRKIKFHAVETLVYKICWRKS